MMISKDQCMRSKLFVPASRPELFAKALASAADAISFDLEDAVEESSKPAARTALQTLFQQDLSAHHKLIVVRINATDTPHFVADLDAVVCTATHVVNIPMVEDPDTVRAVAAELERLEKARGLARPIGILVNIESPKGLRRAAELACAHPRVVGLQIGFGDLFAPLGIVSCEPSALQAVRVAVRFAAAEASIHAYDGAFVDIKNPEAFKLDAQAAQRLGFSGKSCIHPTQIALANEVFRPSDAAIAHAVRVLEETRKKLAEGVGAFVVDGRLIDGPFITEAEHTVALAKRLGLLS
jgi:citrate lyase subunit beta / citryl-CoA lyase